MYNPWNTEAWTTNPWADSSSKWTPEIKRLVGYVNANDGIFYLTSQDFFNIYTQVEWAEVNTNYEISFIDIPIDAKDSKSKEYTANLKISGNTDNQSVFVYIDKPDGRLLQNCDAPYEIKSMQAVSSKGVRISSTKENRYVVILNSDDSYSFTATIVNQASFSKYLTVTAYHPKGVLTFPSSFDKVAEKGCAALLKNCNGNGKCDYFSGSCVCFKGFGGIDCGTKVAIPCPGNCSGNGVCNPNTGICSCKTGFYGSKCSPCFNVKATECPTLKMSSCEATHENFNYMRKNCQQFCGDMGYKTGFESCYVPRDPVKYPCKYLEDSFATADCQKFINRCKNSFNTTIKKGCAKTCCIHR